MIRGTTNGTQLSSTREVVGESYEWVKTDAAPGGKELRDADPRELGQSTTPSNANNYDGSA